jgi:uncharacterized protein (DUF2147 family)
MNIKKITLLVLLIIPTAFVEAANQDDIVGYWLSESKKGVIEITRNGDYYEGNIVWIKDVYEKKTKQPLDINNPDESLQTRKLLGLQNLKGFKFKQKKWQGGTVYDPQKGKTYSSYLYMADQNTLKLRGFIGVALFGRTSTMIRQLSAIPDSYAQ